jgi:hypothetical protein
MSRWPLTIIMVACLAVAACEAEQEPPPPIEETVFADQVKALDKARAVEDISDERMKKLKDSLDEQEQGSGGN